ncbi:MAG: hypothetical protein WA919_24410 [Coleofasciculaceae cyanobacterium]
MFSDRTLADGRQEFNASDFSLTTMKQPCLPQGGLSWVFFP